MKIILFTDKGRNKVKKIKFVFIEYVPASKKLEEFDEVARFEPNLIRNAYEILKNLKNNSRGCPFSYYLGAVFEDGTTKKIK